MSIHQLVLYSGLVLFFCFLTELSRGQSNFWEQTNGPYGLTTSRSVLAITSDSITHMYVSTFSPTKIYRTTNEGEDWTETSPIVTEAYGLATNLIGDVFAATFQGVLKSTDHGVTWTQHTSGLTTTQLGTIVALSNGDILVGTWYGGIFRSSDQGENWTESGLSTATNIEGIFPGPLGVVFARIRVTSGPTLFKSTNFGNTWIAWPNPPQGGFTFAYDSFGRIYASAYHGPAWMSSDGGISWDSIGIGLPEYVPGSMIHVAPNDDVFLFMVGYGLYRTTDLGQNWKRVERRLARSNGISAIAGMTWTPSQSLAIAADIFGVLRSDDFGTTWEMRNKGLGFTSVAALAADPSGFVYACASTGVLISSDNGGSWIFPDSGDAPIGGMGAVLDSSRNVHVAGPGGFYKSANQGLTWSRYQTYHTGFCITATRQHTLLATDWYVTVMPADQYAGVYRSTDDGTSWSFLFEGVGSPPIRAVGQIGNTIFAGCYKSTDDGLTWQGSPYGSEFCISGFIETQEGNYLAASGDSIYRTTNAGISWSPIAFLGTNTNCMAKDPTGVLYAGTNGLGMFISTDNGISWQQESSGLTDLVVLSITYSQDHHIWCGTASLGVFRSRQAVTGVLEENAQTPVQPLLMQNYPNPFNPSTTIDYQIADRGHVTLKVFDVLGREVATLVDETQEPGGKSVGWNASDVTSGLYFYQLRTGSFVGTRKMLLVK